MRPEFTSDEDTPARLWFTSVNFACRCFNYYSW